MVGVEALIRWNDGERGLVGPALRTARRARRADRPDLGLGRGVGLRLRPRSGAAPGIDLYVVGQHARASCWLPGRDPAGARRDPDGRASRPTAS